MTKEELIKKAENILCNNDSWDPLPFETESAIFECLGALTMTKKKALKDLTEIIETLEERGLC